MLGEDASAELISSGNGEAPFVGKAVVWLPSDADDALRYCASDGLNRPSTPENGPWSGLFIVRDDRGITGSTHLDSGALVLDGQRYSILTQTLYKLEGTSGFAIGRSAVGSAAIGGGRQPRWIVEFTGQGEPPPVARDRHLDANVEMSATSETVQRTESKAIQLASIAVVERLAVQMEDSASTEGERATARVIQAYMDVLRAVVDGESPESLTEATLTNLRHLGEKLKEVVGWYGVAKAILDVVGAFQN